MPIAGGRKGLKIRRHYSAGGKPFPTPARPARLPIRGKRRRRQFRPPPSVRYSVTRFVARASRVCTSVCRAA